MKNLKTILLILSSIIIVILIFFLVKDRKNDKSEKENEKIVSEIKYMDNKLTKLLNGVNNIFLENYKISVIKTSISKQKESSADGKEESSKNTQTNQVNDTSTEEYSLKEETVLTSDGNIDWEAIKNEIELLYFSVPTLTLDLYNKNINQEEILNFNKELDELTIATKEENKEKILIKLANLYRYLPAYASSISQNLEYVGLLETKSNVFNTYVFVDSENWEEASNYSKKAIESFSKNLNNLKDNENNYITQKIYVILNELQSAVDIRDKDIFFIKYKNFLVEAEQINIK